MEKINARYAIVGIIAVLMVAVIGVTYAYWRGMIQGEGAPITLTLDSASIIFTDSQEIANEKVRPGWSTSKTFTIENQGTTVFKYDIYIKDLINTLETEGYLQYKITSSNGYNMEEYASIDKSTTASDFDLATSISIEAGVTQEYTIEIRYVDDPDYDQSADMGKTVSGQLMIRENTGFYKKGTLGYKILEDHSTVLERTNFDEVLGDENATTGVIYKEGTYKEDGEDVYYFAGNVADNWVKFAGFYWRIIRTNEDGSIRLLYHGTSHDSTTSYVELNVSYNEIENNTMYVGYMFGTVGGIEDNRKNTTNSTIKSKTDKWYENNINESYNEYVSQTAIYCNDRASGEYSGSGKMYYAANNRLTKQTVPAENQPTFQCGENAAGGYYGSSRSWVSLNGAYTSSAPSVADKFSKSIKAGGNGQLTYPVGLMTADEVAFAGGLYSKNAPNTYYYQNSEGTSSTGSNSWWTMSPSAYINSLSYLFFVHGNDKNGQLDASTSKAGTGYTIRPVLSLKPEVIVTSGNGTAESPYEVSL